ncbi:h15 domain-containing protein [Trichonephila inaurata madagascariensis]|uniref:H15 domain-containing protein n=1 Tax=Trichonephila inaurata madagascariensis TaxID=2747483 RepID=A0A8X6M9C2_9ARAC|nr:h15 domain-containing protein [Trichonephila inaurata madagascariensis]
MDPVSIIQTLPKTDSDARSRILAFSVSKSETTFKKVVKAISAIDIDGRGASVTAIINWILNNYAIMDPQKLKISVKKAVLKALRENKIARSPGSRGALGIAGSFILEPKKIKTRKASKSERKLNVSQAIMTKDGHLTEEEQ